MSSNARLSHADFTMTGPAALSTHAILQLAVRGDGATRVVTLDPGFQGLPDTAHGGTVLALFDAVAVAAGARTIAGVYRRRVPLATSLTLAVDRTASATCLRLSDGATLLVDGAVERGDVPALREGASAAPEPGGAAFALSRPTVPLPISKTCFACGVENPLGLRVQLSIDDDRVGGRWTVPAPFRTDSGSVALVAITTLLDEAAFWLGALASGESGMTTDLRVQLHGSLAVDSALTVVGSRAAVRVRADDPRYWETDVAVADDHGRILASARITFVAVRGAARKLVTGLLAMNPPEVLRRVFPSYAR